MKLYLSSYRVPVLEELVKLLGKPAAKTKVGLITNAKDYYAERARRFKVRDVLQYFEERGFAVEEVDLRRFRKPTQLKVALATYDLLWAMGGNTFCLREEMWKSGFDEVIHELLADGTVFGGDSAGAIVAGTTLKGTEFADEPGYAEAAVWEGLHLTPHVIVPHVGTAAGLAGVDEMLALHHDDPSLIPLTDFQAFVVNGDHSRTVTAEPAA